MSVSLVRVGDDANGVRTLTLDRPGGHNAIGPDLLAELHAALICAHRDAVRCLVLTGAGEMFSAGGDLAALAGGMATRDIAAERAALERASETVRLIADLPAPTLAGINGAAAGGGMALALACDMRIMRGDARLAYAYGRIGLAGDLGINWLLVRLVGSARARGVALGGAVTADRALALGLVDEVAGAAQFPERLAALAGRLAALPQGAAAEIKRNLDDAAVQDFTAATAQEADSFLRLRDEPAHRAAIAAMLMDSRG